MQATHGAPLDQSLRNIQKFQKPFVWQKRNCGGHCAEQTFSVTRHGTHLGFTQHFETQPCDSKHVSHTTTLCVHVLDTFKSSHHRLTEIRQPKPQLWRRKFWVLSGILDILQGASPSRNPLVSRCHRHNTLRSSSTQHSLTDSADGGLCTWRCLRLNRPNTQATGHGTDSHVIHLLAS